ncbi:MAG: autotransporter outer membrane beta-barrel domain-containing protein [Desulfovibrionaceae bacterium]|nr:autotransporter outer membrane beta-barrel domain-containing protein [Desulfovibrionaceae bacterium]
MDDDISPTIYGTGTLTVQGDQATLSDGTVETLAGDPIGALSTDNGSANGGVLTVTGSSGVITDAYGGYLDLSSGTSGDLGWTASNNTVTITDSSIDYVVVGGYKSGSTSTAGVTGDASNNTVYVSGSKVGNYVIGGKTNTAGNADSNSVTLVNSTTGDVYGGEAMQGSASGNIVRLTDSIVDYVAGANTTSGDATGNYVYIDGGTVTQCLIGGNSGLSGNATNNTVTITGSPNLSTAYITGGMGYDNEEDEDYEGPIEGVDLVTGNTLNIAASSAISAISIRNFETINITIPALTSEYKTTPYLTLTSAKGSDFSGATLSVSALSIAAGTTVSAGDRFLLISNENGLTLGSYSLDMASLSDESQLVSLTASAEVTSTALNLVVDGAAPTEQAKAISEAHAAGSALVVSGADVVAGPGMSAAVAAAMNKDEAPYGLAIFGAVSGSSMRHNTGSHVDLRSFSLVTGPVFGVDTKAGRLTLGAFFEYGTGSYGVEHDASGGDINGDGTLYYMGGGVLARLDLPDTGPGHFYVEASGRAGSLHNNFQSSDSRLSNTRTGAELDYDMDMPYVSAHGGLGYIWNVRPDVSLDIYGKYLWTHIHEDSTVTSTGAHVGYEDFTSNRTRLGARVAYTGSPSFRPYAGAAWEHEYDGRAQTTVRGLDVESADLTGSTAIGELGLTWEAGSVPLTVDFNIQGHAGQRQGIAGNLLVEYRF